MSKKLIPTLSVLALGLALAACNSTQDTTSSTTATSSAVADMEAPTKATLGMIAPEFTLTDVNGKAVQLSDFRGKTVVLEWFNPGCPYVVYAYEQGPLQNMAANLGDDFVWLTINSGAPGKQGAGLDLNKQAYEGWNMSSYLLLDETGMVGRTYEAKTTPHVYIIDEEGTLVYRGALDNAPQGKVRGATQKNYVEQALTDIASGNTIATTETDPYGCSVKYAK